MDSITRIRVAYALRKQGIAVEAIAREVGRDRATVYWWLKGIKQRGIEGYIRHYRAAKKGCRRRKVHSYIVQRMLSIRRAYRDCCGQKIVYLLAQEGIKLSLSTVYRCSDNTGSCASTRARPKDSPPGGVRHPAMSCRWTQSSRAGSLHSRPLILTPARPSSSCAPA